MQKQKKNSWLKKQDVFLLVAQQYKMLLTPMVSAVKSPLLEWVLTAN
jgi:hypothetical protein